MAHYTILCVDDDPTFSDLYRQALEPQGFTVATASNPGAGLEEAKRVKPDLVLLDVMMPEGGGIPDGFELLKRLREDAAFAKTPVIMITALGSGDDVKHGMSLGASLYLSKQDMVPQTLVKEIRRLLPSSEAAR